MKPSPPKKPAPSRFCQAISSVTDFSRDQKGLLAADQRLAGLQQRGDDRAGKARREGDMAGAARGEIGDEERAAAERAPRPAKKPPPVWVSIVIGSFIQAIVLVWL